MRHNEILKKEELYITAFVLLSVYLSLGENLIPKPFPWMKLGLSNIITLIILEKYTKKMALEVVGLRIFIQGIMMGTIFTPTFIISMLAGLVSTASTILIYRWRNNLSLISISSISAFIHNLIQLIVVYFLMFRNIEVNSKSILIFIFLFLGLGLLSGAIIGVIVEKIKIRKVGKV